MNSVNCYDVVVGYNVISRLDYCNSLLAGLPWSTIAPLYRVLKTPLLGSFWGFLHVRPVLRELHGLPVIYRIKFKICLFMYLAHTHRCPYYVSHILSPVSNNPFRQRLRSSEGTDYDSTCINTKFDEQAFRISNPCHWNTLPVTFRDAIDIRL